MREEPFLPMAPRRSVYYIRLQPLSHTLPAAPADGAIRGALPFGGHRHRVSLGRVEEVDARIPRGAELLRRLLVRVLVAPRHRAWLGLGSGSGLRLGLWFWAPGHRAVLKQGGGIGDIVGGGVESAASEVARSDLYA